MTNFTTKLMIAAATVVVAAGTATAQTMKAEIPFAFRVSGKTMEAGSYRVSALSTNAGFKTYSLVGTKTYSVASPIAQRDPDKNWKSHGLPVLAFECAGDRCSLVGLWNGSSPSADQFARPKLGKNETARIVLIDLEGAQKAD
jgi:hypothetical protein